MPDFGRIVKAVDAGANHLAIHFLQNYRQFVGKDGFPGCADAIYRHSERVGEFNCRQPIGDSFQDFRSRLILHVSINEREFFIINKETNSHCGSGFRNFFKFFPKKTEKYLKFLCIWCICSYNLIKTMYANLLSLIFILSTTGAGVWFLTQV
jgi:hypothetical protein